MKIEELCEHIRTKGEPLRVDDVTIETGDKTLQAHGTLEVGKSEFRLRLATRGDECPLPTGVFTPEQFWRITGVIDDEIPFTAHGLPSSTQSGFSALPYSRAIFGVHSLSLVKEITEAEREEREQQVADMLRSFAKFTKGKQAHWEPPTKEEPVQIRHHARLIRYPLMWKNSETETKREAPLGRKSRNSKWNVLHATFAECDFVLTQEGDDCLVDVTPVGDGVIEAAHLEKIFCSVLWALAFVSGKDAWPQETKVSGSYHTLKHVVTVPQDTPRSRSPLLNATACANGADIVEAIKTATMFFLNNPASIAENVHKLLYLARNAASSSTPHDVGTLALCSILEGIVDLLDGLYCSGKQSNDEEAFLSAKNALVSACKERKAVLPSNDLAGIRAYERLTGMIGAAHFARFKEKLPRLVKHFGLKWEGCFDLALQSWQKHRNPLAHGRLAKCDGDELESQSMIAGAINLLTAAAMGYKGLAVFSTVESKYQRI